MAKKIVIVAGLAIVSTAAFVGILSCLASVNQERTIEEVMVPVDTFIKQHPDFLVDSLGAVLQGEAEPSEKMAEVNDQPITWGEFEFRKGMSKYSGLTTPADSDVFRSLVEEKVMLSYAVEEGILPTTEQVDDFLSMEKEWYNESEGTYKETADALMRTGGMTADEYWNVCERYNAFAILAYDNCYANAIGKAQETGALAGNATLEQSEEYWQAVKASLMANASVVIVDDKGLHLRFDPERPQ